ncbi:hypothetical protein EU538_02910 [Candidatus Thorarchaeota archaeon]|jgi:Icc-related predicted phosphoesterase|nr:MAG: hypothetical protein EU538_02910 [Candidatus Thorarchaeota archaeon]
MRILAVADVHCPRFLEEFRASLEAVDPPDLFLMAGDMINRGNVEQFTTVLKALDETIGTRFPIIACFGNEEYSETRDEILTLVGERILFLDEKSIVLRLNGRNIGIVGTQGSLDTPTSWQRRNVPRIRRIFERRAERAEILLRQLSDKSDVRILLMHYSPCVETCEGERTRSFRWLGSRKFYNVIQSERPELVIHGHVHNASVHEARFGSTVVRNVALPAVGGVTELLLPDESDGEIH